MMRAGGEGGGKSWKLGRGRMRVVMRAGVRENQGGICTSSRTCAFQFPQVVCGVLGVVLAFAMLAPIGWMLSDIILIARFLIKPSPKTTFVIYLYIIGWSKSL